MDADDVALPERFLRQVRFLRDHARVAVVGTAMWAVRPDGSLLWPMTYPTDAAAVRRTLPADCCLAHPSVMTLHIAILGLVSAILNWLAFYPPHGYTGFIQRSGRRSFGNIH